jgi:ornithine cyclodeaminase/alanine dehydrogenase
MTAFYDTETVRSLATPDLALEAARSGFEIEAAGRSHLPPRIDVPTSAGFYRCMPAALGDYTGLKVMAMVNGLGNRYLALLHSLHTGELLAIFDAEQLTAQRTAAVTVLAGNMMVAQPPETMALIGTGMEASSHLRMMAATWPLNRVTVWSRDADRRREFAARHSEELEIDVIAAPTREAAVTASSLVVLATKSETPVVDGSALHSDTVVLSIGSTRPALRELDDITMRRSSCLVVDNAVQVLGESGDIQRAVAAGLLSAEWFVELGELVTKGTSLDVTVENGRDLRTFKSVGTALQDLALAGRIFELGVEHASRELGTLTELKV